ncbi:NADPH-dependent 7-cyano-7-deazaguanine reductase QueF [Dokdonella fugitiva]|jgi:7-cyano-7-deazaguanine reductase|uniref:NADPH-dependent 7-cyano-7-deazaguanine reductase n=1 Tax=Dokdonella fugitiva TaxID=328517 RepID=A0A4R2IF04_9GAMM|nr:NADPH-dependent 7-cyano-7-deazaguanine reductase QueF [Dokdonella fugitiva]MBA8882743.1 7-cyano-7-deazaguanine reductase [Dokdonella fugitiva]TCO43281.1 7-cyano-7-deazaguanine reductase [Dokdonella fugitiva]
MTTADTHGPLGRSVAYASRYDAGLLFPIARSIGRAELGLDASLPFDGVDVWNAYELSWLDARGKPEVALAEFRVPAASPAIIESKSFKLYLNSYNQERLASIDALRERLVHDLSAAAGASVEVLLLPPSRFGSLALRELDGESIDGLAIDVDDYGPPNDAHLHAGGVPVTETLVSNLLKSNCPVTGQPDWASVQVRYRGPRIDREGLLRYLVSFREHAGFHEQCVERIFVDISRRCAPESLEVYARYTRRGGLDINPWRASSGAGVANPRGARQ